MFVSWCSGKIHNKKHKKHNVFGGDMASHKELTIDEKIELKKDRANKMSIYALAKKYGISRTQVNSILGDIEPLLISELKAKQKIHPLIFV